MSQAEISRLRAEEVAKIARLRTEAAAKAAREALKRVGEAPMGSTVMLDLDSFLALRSAYSALVELAGADMVVMGRTVTYRATERRASRPVIA